MPGQTGWALARRARELQPEIAVIYMTGDSAHEWTQQGVPESVLISKPFRHAQLVMAIDNFFSAQATIVDTKA